jgi:hypothetical protein
MSWNSHPIKHYERAVGDSTNRIRTMCLLGMHISLPIQLVRDAMEHLCNHKRPVPINPAPSLASPCTDAAARLPQCNISTTAANHDVTILPDTRRSYARTNCCMDPRTPWTDERRLNVPSPPSSPPITLAQAELHNDTSTSRPKSDSMLSFTCDDTAACSRDCEGPMPSDLLSNSFIKDLSTDNPHGDVSPLTSTTVTGWYAMAKGQNLARLTPAGCRLCDPSKAPIAMHMMPLGTDDATASSSYRDDRAFIPQLARTPENL